MSNFNVNKLVQPECGSPNPLVAAAQQIAMRPSTATPTMGPQHHQPGPRLNFSREFSKLHISKDTQTATTSRTQPQIQQHNLQIQQLHQQQQQYTSGLPQAPLSTDQLRGSLGPMAGPIVAPMAGDQLETKYRNEMQQTREGKVDDAQFWASLAQKYVGPATTDNIAKFRDQRQTTTDTAAPSTSAQQQIAADSTQEASSEILDTQPSQSMLDRMEYHFDERNPLKDQYDDPFAEGLERLKQGDIPSAALLFEAAAQKEPENSLVWRYLGTTQAQNEKDMGAIKALSRCLALNKDDQEARLAIAVSLVNEQLHHDACKALLQWLMNHPRYRSVNANLEDFTQLDSELSDDPFYINSIADKHYDYVKEKFMAAARMSPNDPDPDVQNSLGVLFNIRSEYELAVDCFKAGLSVRSDDSLLWNRLGATLANGNRAEEAVVAYRRALEISPGFLRCRFNLAISLIHLNLYNEAARQLVQILNMQAAGKGRGNPKISTRSLTSGTIWNALRTVATLLNKPDYYPMIDGRDLDQCNRILLADVDRSMSATTTTGSRSGEQRMEPNSSPTTRAADIASASGSSPVGELAADNSQPVELGTN